MSTTGGAFNPNQPIDFSGAVTFTGAQQFNGLSRLTGIVAPVSGSGTTATGLGVAARGSTYLNSQTQVLYINENSATDLYWTPIAMSDTVNLLSGYTDFRDGLGKAVDNTDAGAILAGSGLRIFGQGIAEVDSGAVVTQQEGGPRMRLTTTDEDAHLVALSFLSADGATLPMQPDTHGPMVVEAVVNQVSAVTLRRFFIGFLGTVANALDPPATGATVTITLVQDDLAGLFFDAGLTAADTLCGIWNNADGAATQTVAATTTGTTVAAAGTSMLFRVELSTTGTMYCFRNRVLVATVASAVDITEEFAPVLLIGSTSTAVKSCDVLRFGTWCKRPNP